MTKNQTSDDEMMFCDHCNKPIPEGTPYVGVCLAEETLNGASISVNKAVSVAVWHKECSTAGMAQNQILRPYQSEYAV